MKIIVTGGAGFIGSHVVDAYINSGHQVTILDNLSTGTKEYINSKAKFIEVDIQSSKIKTIINKIKPDIINHHAAHIHVGRSVTDPAHDASVNIFGTINLLQSAIEIGTVKKIIFASTGGAMYGHKQTPFTETMMPSPLSPYGVSKASAELYLNFYFHQYRLPYIVLRYANVYGPRQNPAGEAGVVSIFCEKLLTHQQPHINGDGKQTRDYVYVKDVARANTISLSNSEVGCFNIGTATETSVNQIYDEISRSLGIKVKVQYGPPRPGEQLTSSLDFHKAKTILGWEPTVSLKNGIAETTNFFRSKYAE